MLGQGCITGHQNSRPAAKKVACSTMCQDPDCIPRANAAGICHTTKTAEVASRQDVDRVNTLPNCCIDGRANIGPIATSTKLPGRPALNIITGSPNQINGGASVMSSRC